MMYILRLQGLEANQIPEKFPLLLIQRHSIQDVPTAEREGQEDVEPKKEEFDSKIAVSHLEWFKEQQKKKTYLQNEPLTNADQFPIPTWMDKEQFFKNLEKHYQKQKAGQGYSRSAENIIGTQENRELAVKTAYFVIHDTAGTTNITKKNMPPAAGGVNLFIGPDNLYMHRDWSNPGYAVALESAAYHYLGKKEKVNKPFLHVEMVRKAYSPASYTDQQYEDLANAYLVASLRAGHFLTITVHKEVDRGVDGSHNDPEGFEMDKLYRIIAKKAGLPQNTTFGIQANRVNKDNMAGYQNQFWDYLIGKIKRVNQYGSIILSKNKQDIWDIWKKKVFGY